MAVGGKDGGSVGIGWPRPGPKTPTGEVGRRRAAIARRTPLRANASLRAKAPLHAKASLRAKTPPRAKGADSIAPDAKARAAGMTRSVGKAGRVAPRKPLPARRSKPRRGRQRDAKHLDFIRSLPCAVTRMEGSDPHHLLRLPAGEARGAGRKADDKWTIPLVHGRHMALHADGDEVRWLAERGIDGPTLAAALWAASGDRAAALAALARLAWRGEPVASALPDGDAPAHRSPRGR